GSEAALDYRTKLLESPSRCQGLPMIKREASNAGGDLIRGEAGCRAVTASGRSVRMTSMIKRIHFSCWIPLTTALLAASSICAAEPSSEDVEFFENQVRPLLAQRCYACHSVRADRREGGLLLDSRPGWMEGG